MKRFLVLALILVMFAVPVSAKRTSRSTGGGGGSGDITSVIGGTGITVTGGDTGDATVNSDLGTSIDISDETNLVAGDGLTLADDTLSNDVGNTTKITSAELENTGNITIDAINAAAHSTVAIGNSDGTYKCDLTVEGNLVLSGGSVEVGSNSIAGAFDLFDGSSNNISISAPALSADYDLVLPTTDGSASEFLQTDGSGNLSWQTVSASVDKLEEGNTKVEAVDAGDGDIDFVEDGTEYFTLTGGTFTAQNAGKIGIADGTVGAPSLCIADTTTIGFYQDNASSIAVANNSTNICQFHQNGVLINNGQLANIDFTWYFDNGAGLLMDATNGVVAFNSAKIATADFGVSSDLTTDVFKVDATGYGTLLMGTNINTTYRLEIEAPDAANLGLLLLDQDDTGTSALIVGTNAGTGNHITFDTNEFVVSSTGQVTSAVGYNLGDTDWVGISGNELLTFYTAGYANFSGCNVGIGTTAPEALLSVDGAVQQGSATVDTGTFTMIKGAQTGDPQFQISLSADASANVSMIADTGDIALTATAGDMDFTASADGFNFSAGGGAGDDFIFDTTTIVAESDNNRIGNGTATPFDNISGGATDLDGAGIHVYNASNDGRIICEGNPAQLYFIDLGGGANDKCINLAVDAGLMTIRARNDDLSVLQDNILNIDLGAGRVGMGAATIDARLEVDIPNADDTDGILITQRDTATAAGLKITHAGTGNLIDAEGFIVDGSSNVGIGSASPNTTLDVNGTVTATDYDGATRTINFDLGSAMIAGVFVTDGDATQGAEIDRTGPNVKILFDDTTDEAIVLQGIMPGDYEGALTAKLVFSMASGEANEVEWEAAIMAYTPVTDTADMDTASFDTIAVGAYTVSATAGEGYVVNIDLSSVTDSLVGNDMFYLYISTDSDDATNDDATGDRELRQAALTYLE